MYKIVSEGIKWNGVMYTPGLAVKIWFRGKAGYHIVAGIIDCIDEEYHRIVLRDLTRSTIRELTEASILIEEIVKME